MQEAAREGKEKKSKGFLPLKLALLLLAGAGLVLLVSWQFRIAEKREQLSALQAQITQQDARNEEIKETVGSLENEEGLKGYAEKKAREELDYAKPGERVFVDVGGGD